MNSRLPATRLSSSRNLENPPSAGSEATRAGRLLFLICFGLSLAVVPFSAALPQQGNDAASASTVGIVQQLVARNEQRAQQLGPYTSRRHYHVAYRGFPHAAEADMVVDVTCDGPSSKKFEIVSQSGSHLLIDHVLKKLLETEQDASHNRKDSALTPANYSFTLVKTETDQDRPAYVLTVEPKERRTLLYRGTIWVDARDYAVAKVEAEPAKNPSFWIRNTEIHHVYQKNGEFWLPQSDRSETKVRLGGTAVLTIDYGDYHFANSAPTQAASAASAINTQPN